MLSACATPQSGPLDAPGGSGPAASSTYESSYTPDTAFGTSRSSNGGSFDAVENALKPNQTLGFGDNTRLLFTYPEQFDCVVQPGDDRNYNGKPAELDPAEFYTPECQVGAPSTLAPSGMTSKKTDPIYVLVPFFETDKKTPAFSKKLGVALKKLFGFVPDAFKPNPGVPVQCPAPQDQPATCTMHPLQTDLGPLLTQLGLLPQNTNLYVPLVNHDHLLKNDSLNLPAIWWQVIVVLVEDPSAWPNANGTSGITSISKLLAAQKAKRASADVPSNFFLYFSSKSMGKGMASMPGMTR
jgi:hypothetical protein